MVQDEGIGKQLYAPDVKLMNNVVSSRRHGKVMAIHHVIFNLRVAVSEGSRASTVPHGVFSSIESMLPSRATL